MANQYLNYEGLQRLVENIDKKYAPIAAIVFQSNIANIESLPVLTGVKTGWMYNIQTGGETTEEFVEGAGHVIADGENVAAVELITGYEAIVSPSSMDDPKALGWYELENTEYVLSNDRLPDVEKTYYEATKIKKWDTFGGLFDLESKYLEFGDKFPQGPASRLVDGRTFLYMGETSKVYTYVVSPEGRPVENGYFEGIFTEVADATIYYNPKQQGLYEPIDPEVAVYAEVTPTGGENPSAEGWYEEDTATPGTYIPTSDTTVDPGSTGKKYYIKNVAYVLSEDVTVDDTKTYFTGVLEASAATSVVANKIYYTESDHYKKAVIYKYNATTNDWEPQSSSTGDMIPITTKEIDDLFI